MEHLKTVPEAGAVMRRIAADVAGALGVDVEFRLGVLVRGVPSVDRVPVQVIDDIAAKLLHLRPKLLHLRPKLLHLGVNVRP